MRRFDRWNRSLLRTLALLAATAALWPAGGCGSSATEADLAIVEPRPGRVLAPRPNAAEGVAIVYSYREDLNLKLGIEKNYRFDLHKGHKIYEKLLADGVISPSDVFVPEPADDAMLTRYHTADYVKSLDDRSVVDAILDSGMAGLQSKTDHVERIVGAARAAVGGTVLAAEQAAVCGLAVHLGGGYKHALPDRGAHACLVSDVPIAIEVLRERKLADRIMIIDTGALQANGIAVYVSDKEGFYLLDIYERGNYPQTKQVEEHGIPIGNGMGDGEYLSLLRGRLPAAMDEFRPQFVFYLAGVDVADGDNVGRTKLSLAGVLDRDRAVIETVRGRNVPLCMLLSSGWQQDSWWLHYRTLRWMLARYGGVEFHVPIVEE